MIKFRIIRHNRDPRFFKYVCDDTIGKNDSIVKFTTNEFIVHPDIIDNCGFWIHEFTEIALIRLLNSAPFRKPWRRSVRFEGFKRTAVVHLISPYGVPNGRTLFPQKNKNDPEW